MNTSLTERAEKIIVGTVGVISSEITRFFINYHSATHGHVHSDEAYQIQMIDGMRRASLGMIYGDEERRNDGILKYNQARMARLR